MTEQHPATDYSKEIPVAMRGASFNRIPVETAVRLAQGYTEKHASLDCPVHREAVYFMQNVLAAKNPARALKHWNDLHAYLQSGVCGEDGCAA